MVDLPYDDVYQMYFGSTVVFDGKLVYINKVHPDNDEICVKFTRLEDGHVYERVFDRTLFKAPNRIGYVNTANAAWFFSRIPGRMFKVGLSPNNCKISATEGFFAVRGMPNISSKELQAAHDNIYPSLYKAWLTVKDKARACMAFDHQFAICNQRFIYFKGRLVGSIPKGNVRKSNIVWNNKFEFLADILEPDYEKTVRTFG